MGRVDSDINQTPTTISYPDDDQGGIEHGPTPTQGDPQQPSQPQQPEVPPMEVPGGDETPAQIPEKGRNKKVA